MIHKTVRPTTVGILALVLFATSACTHAGFSPVPTPAPAASLAAEPIVTDRPDFTESAVTVPQGMIQIEAGQTLTQEDRQQSVTFGETLVRVGLSKRFELRLTPASIALAQDGNALRLGREDAGVGMKVAFLDAGVGSRRWIPAVALIVDASVPTGATMFRSEHVLPGAKGLLAWDLTDRVAFSSNLNWALSEDPAIGTHNEWSVSGSVGVGLSDRWGAYTEYYGFGENAQGWQRRDYVNGGVTFQPIPSLQFDARVGVGPSISRRDYFVGLGLSRRW
ncbi:MAG: transporter [Gemmatimonadaceae bacterium]|nr:transporter [Gemmatimonadaceae bacterium]